MDATIQKTSDDTRNIVFPTGAGISTASGIPDFRSANGLYTQNRNAEYYLSRRYFASDPEGFYKFCKQNLYFPDAKPSVIHQEQAALIQQDRATVITQGTNNLYEEAGTKHSIGSYGNLFHVYYEKCHEIIPVSEYLSSHLHQKDNGPLRPDIVLYNEGIRQEDIVNSVKAMQQADLVMIVGISMEVYPFAGLLDYRNPNAKVIAASQQLLQFPFDFQMIQDDATKFFDELKV